MAGRMYSVSEGREAFYWFFCDGGKKICIGRRYAGAWIPAAEISVLDAQLAAVSPWCRTSPLLFDIVESLCAGCEEKQKAA